MILIVNKDYELKLLAGLPIEVENIGELYPLKLIDMATIGETKYNRILSCLLFDPKDLISQNGIEDSEEINQLTTYDILMGNAIKDEEYRKIVLEGLSLFFKESVELYYDNQYSFLYLGKLEENNTKIIHRENYELVIEILKLQNCLKNLSSDDEFNANDSKAKEIIEKIKKSRKKINENKSGEQEKLDLMDLISVLSANGNGLNINNIWDLTMFQFNNQFNRMQMLEEYKINIRSLLAGAKSEDIELKHWMRKIK